MNELIERYLRQGGDDFFAKFVLRCLMEDCEFDEKKVAKISWGIHDVIETNKETHGCMREFSGFLNSPHPQELVSFYWHVCTMLTHNVLHKVEAGPGAFELEREVELARVWDLDLRELFIPAHVFPRAELADIVKELTHRAGEERTTVERFLTAIVDLYEKRREAYMTKLEGLGTTALSTKQDSSLVPRCNFDSFYRYVAVVPPIQEAGKRRPKPRSVPRSPADSARLDSSQASSPPAILIQLQQQNGKKKKKPGKNVPKYVSAAEGNFEKLEASNPVIALLHKKVLELEKVVCGIEGTRGELNAKVQGLERENRVIQQENGGLRSALEKHLKDPRQTDLAKLIKVDEKVVPKSSS